MQVANAMVARFFAVRAIIPAKMEKPQPNADMFCRVRFQRCDHVGLVRAMVGYVKCFDVAEKPVGGPGIIPDLPQVGLGEATSSDDWWKVFVALDGKRLVPPLPDVTAPFVMLVIPADVGVL